MGETAYIVHSFPCDSAAPPPPLQEERINPLDALGDSISFGRFLNESLTWDDKWSDSPQKRHVEEAEKYSKPGSVAKKKAFFEAHYKRIAAIKAAAATLIQDQPPQSHHENPHLQTIMSTSDHNAHENPSDQCLSDVEIADPVNDVSLNQLNNTDKDHTVISSVTPHEMEKEPVDISSSSFEQVSEAPCSPTKSEAPTNLLEENVVIPNVKISEMESADRIKPSQQSLRKLFTSSPVREPNEVNIPVAEVVEISKVAPDSSSDASKDYTASIPTKANLTEMQKHPLTITLSEIKRTNSSLSAYRTKRTRSKWHILVALCSKSLRSCRTNLCLSSSSRKEEMASRRKQKVTQKKINDNEALEVELQTKFKQVETEVKKLRKSLFSNSKKLPDVYNEREKSKSKQIPKCCKL